MIDPAVVVKRDIQIAGSDLRPDRWRRIDDDRMCVSRPGRDGIGKSERRNQTDGASGTLETHLNVLSGEDWPVQ
jgi:hypothetical protein